MSVGEQQTCLRWHTPPAIGFRQCRLQRVFGPAVEEQTTWLPERFPHAGCVVRLMNDAGVWEDGWQVCEVFS